MSPEIVITGFPKCGTTALMRAFGADPELQVLKKPNGAVELTWPLIQTIKIPPHDGKILAHKFTAYIFNEDALEYLAGINPNSAIVLCIRDPKKSLISWHRMHQSIAKSGRNKQHLAYREREFYATCTVSEYYERYAQRRLRYDKHFRTLLSIVPKERVVVVSQERMAKDMDAVSSLIKSIAKGEEITTAPASDNKDNYKSYADKSGTVLDVVIERKLNRVQKRLHNMIAKSGVRTCI